MATKPIVNLNEKDDELNLELSIDQLTENMPIGSISRAISNNLYGIDIRQTNPYIPRSRDHYGFTFFVRPQLNLSRLNISNYRNFYSLLTDNPISYQRYTRLMLDPRLAYQDEELKSPLVDDLNPFIPILTNNIISVSGWPDLVVPTYTSESGNYNQEHSFVDGVVNHYEAFDLDITFKNIKGNPLLYFFYIWIKYESLVFEGVLTPYIDFIAENEIDYNTRIYRLVLDEQKRYVRYIACTGASYPISVPTGSLFDYDNSKPLNTSNSEINIRFRNIGFVAFDDIIKLWFNKTLGIFNPSFRELVRFDLESTESNPNVTRNDPFKVYYTPDSQYVKIPYSFAMQATDNIINNLFYNVSHRAYPYINLYTNELEFWVLAERFNKSAKDLFEQEIRDKTPQAEEEFGD